MPEPTTNSSGCARVRSRVATCMRATSTSGSFGWSIAIGRREERGSLHVRAVVRAAGGHAQQCRAELWQQLTELVGLGEVDTDPSAVTTEGVAVRPFDLGHSDAVRARPVGYHVERRQTHADAQPRHRVTDGFGDPAQEGRAAVQVAAVLTRAIHRGEQLVQQVTVAVLDVDEVEPGVCREHRRVGEPLDQVVEFAVREHLRRSGTDAGVENRVLVGRARLGRAVEGVPSARSGSAGAPRRPVCRGPLRTVPERRCRSAPQGPRRCVRRCRAGAGWPAHPDAQRRPRLPTAVPHRTLRSVPSGDGPSRSDVRHRRRPTPPWGGSRSGWRAASRMVERFAQGTRGVDLVVDGQRVVEFNQTGTQRRCILETTDLGERPRHTPIHVWVMVARSTRRRPEGGGSPAGACQVPSVAIRGSPPSQTRPATPAASLPPLGEAPLERRQREAMAERRVRSGSCPIRSARR